MHLKTLGFVAACASLTRVAMACSTFGSDDPAAPGAEGGTDPGPDGAVDGGARPVDAASGHEGGSSSGLLATGQNTLFGIAATETHVFYSEQVPGLVHRVAFDGTGATILSAPAGSPRTIAIRDSDAYWSDITRADVLRFHDDDDTVTSSSATPSLSPVDVAVSHLVLVVLANSATAAVIEVRDPTTLALDLNRTGTVASKTFDIAVNQEDIYWTDTAQGNVMHAADGNVQIVLAPLASSESDCRYLAADDFGVYWTLGDGRIRAKLKAESAARDIAIGQESPTAIASDTSGVYWIAGSGNAGVIRRWDRVNAASTDVVKGFQPLETQRAHALALSSEYVVWLTGDGSVMKHAK